MADQLKTFMIGLGFQIDQQGMAKIEAFAKSSENYARQMAASIDKLTKTVEQSTKVNVKHVEGHRQLHEVWKTGKNLVLGFAGALTTLAITGEEAVRRVSKQFSDLYFLSQRTGVSATALETLRFQFEKVGLSASGADSAVSGLASRIRSSPGMLHQIQGLVGPVNDASEAIQKLAQRYARVLAMRSPGQEAAERSILESLGLNPDEILQVAQNIDRATGAAKDFTDILRRLGYGDGAAFLKRLQDNSLAFQDQWINTQKITATFWQGFANSLMPSATRLLGVFNRSVGNISDQFDGLERAAKDFLDELIGPDGKKGEAWLKDLISQLREFFTELNKPDPKGFAKDVRDIGDAITWLVGKIKWLKDEIGIVPTLFLLAFGPSLIKGLVFGLGTQIVTAFTGLGTTAGAAFAAGWRGAVLRILPFLGFGLSLGDEVRKNPDKYPDLQPPDKEKGIIPGESMQEYMRRQRSVLPPTTPGPRSSLDGGSASPVSYRPTAAEGPDQLTTWIQALAANFANWWSGSAAYNPIVQLADSVYEKLRNTLEQLLGGGCAPGGAPAASTGSGTAGRGGPGGRFRGAGPGATGEGTQPAPPGAEGQYRPQYKLGEADLSEQVINTIAGEATASQESTDAVINNMFNRLGTKGYGPSGNLQEVARAPGQYAGYQKASAERAAQIRKRIEAIASGSVPDITGGANEFRAGSYTGAWAQRNANAPVIGGNRFAYNPAGGRSPYAPYAPGAGPGGGPGGAAGGPGEGGPNAAANAVDAMLRLEGAGEHAPQVKAFLKAGGVGLDPRYAAWCAAFLSSAYQQFGIKGAGNVARNFLRSGQPVDPRQAQKGDAVVLPRGGSSGPGGHVGAATGNVRDGFIEIIQGNKSDKVMRSWERISDVVVRRLGDAANAVGRGTSLGTDSFKANLGSEKRAPMPVSVERGADAGGDYGGGGDVIHKSETTISVVGAADPHGTAEAVRRIQDRHSPMLFRNRKAAIV